MEEASYYNERQKQEQMFVNEERQASVVKLRVGGSCYSGPSDSRCKVLRSRTARDHSVGFCYRRIDKKVREHRQKGIQQEGIEIILKKRDNTQIWGTNILNKVWKSRNNVKRHTNKVNRQENNKTKRVIKGKKI